MITNKLTKIIERNQSRELDDSRDYIGASSIGSDCLRQIWYQFKGVKGIQIPTKTKRTWAIGKKLENLVIQWLLDAGVDYQSANVTYVSKNLPFFQGHFDGFVVFGKKIFILEVKTAKHSSFNIVLKKGVRVWSEQYYAQVQSYMGMSGIHNAYVIVLNKDTSDLYDELIQFDEDYYKKLEAKALMISTATIEPPKINGSPLWFQCKMCKYNKVCHK